MKTMKLGEEIRKVKEEQVNSYLENGWNYCPRSEWKTKVRDPEMKSKKSEDVEIVEEKKKGNPKGKAKKNKQE